ncbi:hypothetical protein EXS62_02950 [Candidatus Kaiserbacteria bacterium]|nr:hypothetical protein [Candidatus Kaiserbacteria bacterium]
MSLSPFLRNTRRALGRAWRATYWYLFSLLERLSGGFLTLHIRPFTSGEYGLHSAPTPNLPAYAVILQGPIAEQNDFTLETLRLYKKIFPDGYLILSTWDDTPEEILKPFRAEAGIELVLNIKPNNRGYGNFNYQLVSTQGGLRRARELGAAYAMKIRTDQRIYATDTYQFLLGLLDSFPLHTKTVQRRRLIALGINTVQYRPYSLNDQFFFGTIEDMELYWNIPLDLVPKKKATFTLREWVTLRLVEGYLMTEFLKRIGHTPKDTLADYWDAVGKYFILIDQDMVDLYWCKYKRYREHHDRRYDAVFLSAEIAFRDWVILYKSLYNKETVPEDVWPNLPDSTTTTRVFDPVHSDKNGLQ